VSDPAAVLFDMDGLLIDSEPQWYAAEVAVMRRLGGVWTLADQEHVLGGPLRKAADHLVAVAGVDADPADVEHQLLHAMADELRRRVAFRPGGLELLHDLRAAAVPCALVSSSFRLLVDLVLDVVGREHFAVTVAGDEVARRKPAPDPYLEAARRLHVDPRRCVALEDSPPGVASALAAGCVVVAVPDLAPIPPRPGLLVAESLADLDVAALAGLVARAA
jgi:HAD superfamily hydrolase (TIGR01509 family)